MYENVLAYFGSFAGIAALTVIVAQFFINLFKFEGNAKQYTAWIVSVLLTAIAVLLGVYGNFGVFTGWSVANWKDWLSAITLAISCGLSSNGLYDWNTIQQFLKWIGLLKQ